jgi:hypothetical protein
VVLLNGAGLLALFWEVTWTVARTPLPGAGNPSGSSRGVGTVPGLANRAVRATGTEGALTVSFTCEVEDETTFTGQKVIGASLHPQRTKAISVPAELSLICPEAWSGVPATLDLATNVLGPVRSMAMLRCFAASALGTRTRIVTTWPGLAFASVRSTDPLTLTCNC